MSNKRKKRAAVAAALAILSDKFPKTFTVDPTLRKSLKVGIADDLIVRIDGAIQQHELRLVLARYCGAASYLRACKVGADRLDLDGNVSGTVTAAEAEHARDKLAGLKAKKATANEATKQPQPSLAETPRKRLSIADLKIAARMRKEAAP
jgi:ProP effector